MKIAMVGTGYVGLVTGTCFAESGNDVTCVDIDQKKVDMLLGGEVPIYEPGLTELVKRNAQAGRLHFTTQLAEAVADSQCAFIAVGTPQGDDGSANMGAFWKVVDSLAPILPDDCIVVVKSTVPVGTNRAVSERLRELTGRVCDVVSNPEFLKEGCAIDDFTKPDRVVVGVERPEPAEVLKELYKPFLRTEKPFLSMGLESAEMTKYVANCMLATKISFINEMANVCDGVGADINDVRRGIGHDARIGFSFLFPGVGYGGSCFPKDVRALAAVAAAHKVESQMLDSVDKVNQAQKTVLFSKLQRYFEGDFSGRTIAIWGLAFKPRTDDIREAPALVLIDQLLAEGATVRVHDPVAMDNVKQIYGDKITYWEDQYAALEGADALAINTEWNEFRNPKFDLMSKNLTQPIIFDGRNLYDPAKMRDHGFHYEGIGLR
ncbi:UDP-glucose/GDP-mannose dehydrogenase family protein [Symmachiella dynata]|uniref:UDP-glucose dehydrogenase family protein n=1 Tax=Symmachiella dynata TaxID=2527995 RepID=UPI0030ECCC71